MQLIDPKHRFYRPLPVRIAIVAVCLGWAIVEATTGEPFWGIIVGALGAYSAWMLLLNYRPEPDAPIAPVSRNDDEDED